MKDSTKKYLKRVLIGYLFVLSAFIINHYLDYRNREFYNLSKKTLKAGTEIIYDEKLNIIGEMEYKNTDAGLNLSINGKQIIGKKTESNDIYIFEPMIYESIIMNFKEFKKENCYFYNDEDSIIVLCLLKSWFIKYSSLEKLSVVRKQNGVTKKNRFL